MTTQPPTSAQLKKANMAPIPNPNVVVEANGDKVRSWNGKNFVVPTSVSPTEQLYAVPNSWNPVPTPPPTPPVANYTVTFNAEGGTAVTSETVVAGASIEAPTAPTYSGYNFNGWSDEPNDSSILAFPFSVNENVTLYAQWTPVIVPPTPVAGPSGFAHPSVPTGMTEALFDDFTETTLNTKYWGAQGGGRNDEGALWMPSHVVIENSCLNLCAYADPAIIGQWGVTETEYNAVNGWVAGQQGTNANFPLGPGTRILTAMRTDSLPGLTALALVTALKDHESEGDFVEINAPMTNNDVTIHWGQNNSQEYQSTKTKGVTFNLTNWMVWGIQWDAATIDFLVQLTPTSPLTAWQSWPNPDPTGTWAEEQFLALQFQTNDSIYGANTPNFPAVDTSVTAENPIRQQHDWVQICTSTTTE